MISGPNLLLAGVPRGGTTALAHLLGRHPEVHVGPEKEPHHLAYGSRTRGFSGPGDDLTVNRQLVLDEADYLSLYRAGADRQYRCDASVSTLYGWKQSRTRLGLLAEDTKLILCLREPVDRAYSAHLYLASRGFETLSFAEGLAAEERRVAENWQHMWHYRGCSRYGQQLAQLLEDINPDRVHVVITEELKEQQIDTLTKLFDWLELDVSREVLAPLGEVNRGGVARNPLARSILSGLTMIPGLSQAARRLVPFERRHAIKAKMLVRPELDRQLRRSLGEEFQNDREAVADFLGRMPESWTKD